MEQTEINFSQSNEEIWKHIVGYEGIYQISNFGNVKRNEKLLKIKYKNNGYAFVCFSRNNSLKYFHVHRLVAQAFIPNPENKPTVNHIDGVKSNNKLSNLEWNTFSENALHSFKSLGRKGTNTEKYGKESPLSKPIENYSLISNKTIEEFDSAMCVQRKYKFNAAKICRVARKLYGNKTAYGYGWRFINK